MRTWPFNDRSWVDEFGCGCVVDGSRYVCGPDVVSKGVHLSWCPPHTRNPIPAKDGPMTEKEEQDLVEVMRRGICGGSLQGYCRDVGGYLGCKVGRGEAFNGKNCIASDAALGLSNHDSQARAALQAAKAAGFTISRSRHGISHGREAFEPGPLPTRDGTE